MKLFQSPLRIELSVALQEKAKHFAQAVIGTVNYKDSNQSNKSKIQKDHYVSKLGEEAVRLCFEQFDWQVKGPDYTIYKGKQKSWDADLLIDDIPVAVKTQTIVTAQKYGLSWTFQASSIRRDPILKEPYAWVTFVLLGEDAAFVFPPAQIQELTFRDPFLSYLVGKKKVLYAVDLGYSNSTVSTLIATLSNTK